MAFLTKLVMIRISCVRSILEIISGDSLSKTTFSSLKISIAFDHFHYVQRFVLLLAGISEIRKADATAFIVSIC
jgi:hypothetical protein